MNIIKRFEINKNNTIEILVPELENKFNYYYKPSEKLHKFDEVTAMLIQKNKKFTLKVDAVQVVIEEFKNMLIMALNNQISLPKGVVIGKLGALFNSNTYEDDLDSIDFGNFWLWSGPAVQTWLYNRDNKIYLEIAPSYPWLYVEPEKTEEYISFDQFMKTYKPILVTELDKNLVKKWIKECHGILENLEKEHEQMLQYLAKCKSQFINALKKHNIDLAAGKVTFSDIDTTFENEWPLKNFDGEIQITYRKENTNQPIYVIQVLLRNNIFTIKVIKDLEWDLPVFEEHVSNLNDLFSMIQQTTHLITANKAAIT